VALLSKSVTGTPCCAGLSVALTVTVLPACTEVADTAGVGALVANVEVIMLPLVPETLKALLEKVPVIVAEMTPMVLKTEDWT
jgi:hypothetical protein